MAQNTLVRSNSSAAPTALTPAQLAAMDVQSRNAYFASLPSNQQAAQRQAYQNYLDPELAGWQQAYYGANYSRLLQVRAAYDPDHVLKLPQGIGT